MSNLHILIAALFAATMTVPAMAGSEKTAPNKSEPVASTVPVVKETIVVTGFRDVSFPSFDRMANEGGPGFEFTQHAYGTVDGRWGHVDNLDHTVRPFVQVAMEDMVQKEPGA